MSFQLALELLPPTLADGLILGLLYATIALGYTMVYGVLGLINFAHSEIFMVGAVVAVELLTYVLAGSPLHPVLQLALAMIVAAAVSAALAGLAERVAYRPLRRSNAPKLAPLITAIGISLFLQDAVRFVESLFGQFIRPFPSMPFFDIPLPLTPNDSIPMKSVVILIAAGAMLVGLRYTVNQTRLGKAIRAVATDRMAASLMGIDVNRIVMLTFLIGGALAGVAGTLYALQFGRVDPFSGFIPGLKAFTAAVLGGIGSIPGAMVGGIVLGLIEMLIGTFVPILTNNAIGTEYKDIFAFGILILILIFKPTGLLGRPSTEKV
ncbi:MULTISPECIES: branched-chain amino acid ABC transporter permease [unclassified Bradyrhizobium]|uniref:branched-chain amino acid ABC transporter permease n=1 Tax=unclassified Bradyrhizobium TaxID=2631580 RepID=UPI00041EE393|nr:MULTISPECIES: branched-chain amino acid ABC transporter permease [unclassified Bradyrhizobium]MCP3467350.1 branched-chain amino acid ABC transporter permease [Bradyrhizobium sp. CCGUVB23]